MIPVTGATAACVYAACVDLYYLPAFAVYAAIATATALAYLGLATVAAWGFALYHRRRLRARPSQPGAAVRSVLSDADGRLRRHTTAMLLFVVGACLLSVFGERGWWADLPLRLWAVLVTVLVILHGYGVVRLVQLIRYRARLCRLLDLQQDLHARLHEAQARGYRLHHAVPAGDFCIDTVVTGENGIYALRILLPPPGAENAVLRDGRLTFGPDEQVMNIVPALAGARVLGRELQEATGLAISVQTVLIVPGCRTESGADQNCLLVNLETCGSFVGWRNDTGFLMADDRRRIDAWLAERASRPDRASRNAVRATLGEAIPPPVLV